MVKALNIEFVTRRRGSRLAWRVLAVGILAIGIVLFEYRTAATQLANAIESTESAQRQIDRRRPKSELPVQRVSNTQVIAINRAIAQLNLPWDALFGIFENAKPDTVALLAIDPDGKQQRVKVTGEAKTIDAMLDYLAQLKQKTFFADAVLAKHEVNEQDPERPYRFTLEATWRNEK